MWAGDVACPPEANVPQTKKSPFNWFAMNTYCIKLCLYTILPLHQLSPVFVLSACISEFVNPADKQIFNTSVTL